MNRSTINLINSLSERWNHGAWEISRDELFILLDIELRDAYRQMASCSDPVVDYHIISYNSENAGALVSLLECLGYSDAPRLFWEAGLWVPYEIQVELQELLVEKIVGARNSHDINFHTFLSMFDSFGNFVRSLDCYLEEFFSREEITDRAVWAVIDTHHEVSAERASILLHGLAREFYRREIVPYRNLFVEIFLKLKIFLMEQGRIESEADNRWQSEAEETAGKEDLWARKIFGVGASDPISPGLLKKKYKTLMKIYHPDVNPTGLEQAKEINRAYALLLG